MNSDNIELEDVAEVLAYIISQEKVMAVPPVILPTEGATTPRKRPKKQKRNTYYQKKNPKDAHSVSDSSPLPSMPDAFPIKGDNNNFEGCDGAGGGPGNGQGRRQPADESYILIGDHMMEPEILTHEEIELSEDE